MITVELPATLSRAYRWLRSLLSGRFPLRRRAGSHSPGSLSLVPCRVLFPFCARDLTLRGS